MAVIAVTGGCGFIGSNLVWNLLLDGHEVRILDLRSELPVIHPQQQERSVGHMVLRVGDIRDREACREIMEGADAVVHLAAEAGVVQSLADPLRYTDVNVGGTLNLLMAARAAGVKRFIFASSGAVLGEHMPPGHEEHLTRPTSPYGASKLAGEAYCQAFAASFGLSTAVLRFSNVYGPGSFHKGSVVAEFCKRAIHAQPLIVYGDGCQTRDFLYIGDLLQGIKRCVERQDAVGVFHFSSGKPTTIAEVADLIRELCARDTGTAPALEHQPARPFEVRASYFSNAKACRVLGFAPAMTWTEGIERTWRWFLGWVPRHSAMAGSLA